MHLYYADGGLMHAAGHHVDQCQALTGEIAKRGIACSVLAYVGVDDAVQARFSAARVFRSYVYLQYDRARDRDWMGNFTRAAQMVREDLDSLPNIRRTDILFLPTSSVTYLAGVAAWMASRRPDDLPHVVLDFVLDPAIDAAPSPTGGVTIRLRDPRDDATGTLCRLTAEMLRGIDRSRLHLAYPYANGATVYAMLLQHPVAVNPIWHGYSAHPRSRVGKRPITVGMVGHQHGALKGYHLAAPLIEALLPRLPDIRFLIHNSVPEAMPEAQQALQTLAAREPRVTLIGRAVTAGEWQDLLDRIDLIVCPYSPRSYQLVPSGVQAEAIANAIPSVVPAGTALAEISTQFGGTGTTFMRNDVVTVADAVDAALLRYDEFAAATFAASARWAEHHGTRQAIDRLLACARNDTSA
jgi:glycosyltransferase involved in cell wall biosynthesis